MYLHPQKYGPSTCKSADADADADADTDWCSYVLYNIHSVICGCGYGCGSGYGCGPVYFGLYMHFTICLLSTGEKGLQSLH